MPLPQVELLHGFEVALPLHNADGTPQAASLVPSALMPRAAAGKPAPAVGDTTAPTVMYELKKAVGAFPPAVFGRLLARLHRFASADDCWRGGAAVKDGANTAHLEVSEHQIKLSVWGASPSALRITVLASIALALCA